MKSRFSETKRLMSVRLQTMKASRQQASLVVLGVRMNQTVNLSTANDLVERPADRLR